MGAPTDFYERLERETPELATWTGEMVSNECLDRCRLVF